MPNETDNAIRHLKEIEQKNGKRLRTPKSRMSIIQKQLSPVGSLAKKVSLNHWGSQADNQLLNSTKSLDEKE